MAYQYDIFISYRRHDETRAWIADHFVPLLELRLGQEIDRKPLLYVDTQLESGASWPPLLAQALGGSRILLALWSGNYLSSVWCTQELSHMLDREKQAGLRTAAHPYGLIVPAFIHDGDKFPPELSHIEHFEIQKCFNVRMARNSPRAEQLDDALTAQAPAIAHCIESAPPWQSDWAIEAAEALFQQFYHQASPQADVPRFTAD
jgi:TIR domain